MFLYHYLLLLLNKYNLLYSLDDEIKKKIGTCVPNVPIYFIKNFKITIMMISLFVTIYYNNYICQNRFKRFEICLTCWNH